MDTQTAMLKKINIKKNEETAKSYPLGIMPPGIQDRNQVQKDRELAAYQARWTERRLSRKADVERQFKQLAAVRELQITVPSLLISMVGVYWLAALMLLRVDELFMTLAN